MLLIALSIAAVVALVAAVLTIGCLQVKLEEKQTLLTMTEKAYEDCRERRRAAQDEADELKRRIIPSPYRVEFDDQSYPINAPVCSIFPDRATIFKDFRIVDAAGLTMNTGTVKHEVALNAGDQLHVQFPVRVAIELGNPIEPLDR